MYAIRIFENLFKGLKKRPFRAVKSVAKIEKFGIPSGISRMDLLKV